MGIEYIYAVGDRLCSDEQGQWLFSTPCFNHKQALEIYDLTLVPEQQVRLVVLPENEQGALSPSRGLRQLLSESEEQYFPLLSRAAQVMTWSRDHLYCPRCANALTHHQQDLAKQCESCGLTQYPRLSPCIITLVIRGEYCLLAQGIRFTEPRYSTLAGFIEAGESAEDALVREVREEVGVEVANIRYRCSQSWPFPHSFMLGFFADYVSGEIVPEPGEIVDARWFHYSELKNTPIPPGFTISRQLIDAFLKQYESNGG
ncbi:NAD(+) diphosphatase [Amphritea japonica]|uniref:NAD(+) diphosphatase n=1 Tax=Amphritea japonica ATCC BAA-1530 TaxID=1278309 RepID=A0A7R6PMC9_9GAMM|nr:NAD(+) diphosphatase [Amphritea japonica]BBB26068.1 NAD+ diphosphatase [Amphritea japonica ATCC BAA-1530]